MGAKLKGFNLKELRAHFPNVSRRVLGGPKMKELEDLFAPLKSGFEEFSLRHIEIIKDEDQKYWRFLNWWKMPEISDADIANLKRAFFNIHQAIDKTVVQ